VLSDLGDYQSVRTNAARLDELRLDATESRVEAELALDGTRRWSPDSRRTRHHPPTRCRVQVRLLPPPLRPDHPPQQLAHSQKCVIRVGSSLLREFFAYRIPLPISPMAINYLTTPRGRNHRTAVGGLLGARAAAPKRRANSSDPPGVARSSLRHGHPGSPGREHPAGGGRSSTKGPP
jgi:hypothetical protein